VDTDPVILLLSERPTLRTRSIAQEQRYREIEKFIIRQPPIAYRCLNPRSVVTDDFVYQTLAK